VTTTRSSCELSRRTFSTEIVVLHAPTGHSGLALCKRQSIDCVVLEINLPDMSGYEVLRQLIPFTPDPGIAVIVLTRISDHHLLETAIKYGA
jgi:DNA-binding NarL/FixJ family response regulator